MKIFKVISIVVLLAFMVLTPTMNAHAQGEEPPASEPVTIPAELEVLFAGLVGMVVTQGLKSLFGNFGLDIAKTATIVTAGIVTGIVGFANQWLVLLPEAAKEPTRLAFTLIISILSAMGMFALYKGKQAKPLKA